MEIRQIKYFLGVAETLSFSKAALGLNIAQPALSRQIQQLEQDFKVTLFVRDKRKVALTPAGAYLFEELTKMERRFQDTLAQAVSIQTGHVGSLRIGYPASALYSILPETLVLLREKRPLLEGFLSEMTEQAITENLVNNHVDICFSREGAPDHALLCQRELFSEQLALVVPEAHPLTKQNFTSIRQCRDEGFILTRMADHHQFRKQIYGLFGAENFEPRIAYESNHGATIMRLVEKNLGLSVLPLSYRMGSSLKVRFIPLPAKTTLYLVWRSGDGNPGVRSFMTLCDEAVKGLDLDFECRNK